MKEAAGATLLGLRVAEALTALKATSAAGKKVGIAKKLLVGIITLRQAA